MPPPCMRRSLCSGPDVTMKRKALVIGCIVIGSAGLGRGQAAGSQGPPPGAAVASAKPRALLDQYCVTCHNDRTRTANLSLTQLDLAAVGDHPELWEKVVRKLRAGVMPPPDVKRPPLEEYEALRDWLEAEIDRKAAARVNPGAVVLHRLNRTEYANVVRDLLDLEIDAAALLPSDDSARGFDNIAGSLTLSPTLLEAYTTAAMRVARMAVGFWKTPTESTYLAPGDTSQNRHVEGLPLGTRGGMLIHHQFPADGEYKFSIQNFGIGSFIPGEQLELVVDGETAHRFKYQGVGLSQGMAGDAGDGVLDLTIPVKAGSRSVGATFLATNYRPSLDMIKQYDRKSLENNSVPQLQYYPAIGFLRIQGPFTPQRPTESRSIRKVLTCRPASAGQEEFCAKTILSTLTRRAYRRPATPQDLGELMSFFYEGRPGGTFEDGIELALRRLLASPQFLVRAEKEPLRVPAGRAYRISDLELASRLSFFLWSSIPDDELIAVAGQGRLGQPKVLEQQVRRMLADARSDA